jgi:hypothetical protein
MKYRIFTSSPSPVAILDCCVVVCTVDTELVCPMVVAVENSIVVIISVSEKLQKKYEIFDMYIYF